MLLLLFLLQLIIIIVQVLTRGPEVQQMKHFLFLESCPEQELCRFLVEMAGGNTALASER